MYIAVHALDVCCVEEMRANLLSTLELVQCQRRAMHGLDEAALMSMYTVAESNSKIPV